MFSRCYGYTYFCFAAGVSHDHHRELEVRLLKDVTKGLGINIIDLCESSGETASGSSKIVIESLVKGGPADIDKKLKRGESMI